MKTTLRLPKYHDVCFELQKYGVLSAGLFGSRAFGDATPQSDYDIMVEFAPDSKTTFLGMIELKLQLEDILDAHVDLVTKESLSPYLRESILSSIVPFYGKKN